MFRRLGFAIVVLSSITASALTDAPGVPGSWGSWARPDKSAYGASFSRPLWFTIQDGVLGEIAYPTVDLTQSRNSFLMIVDGNNVVDERKCEHATTRLDKSLIFTVKSVCPNVTITKTFVADPAFDRLVIDYSVEFASERARQFVFVHNPSAAATSGGDGIQVVKGADTAALIATQLDRRGDEPATLHLSSTQTVTWNLSPSQGTVGFEGVSSPEDQLRGFRTLATYDRAFYGNVAGALIHHSSRQRLKFSVSIDFASSTLMSAQTTLALMDPSQTRIDRHVNEWSAYLAKLDYDRSDILAESSILILKALEDKSTPGALIAAPANPAIPWQVEASDHPYEDARKRWGDSNSGYRRVWPRDLYHKGLALLAVNDVETAVNVARFFRTVQLNDGTWSQNMWVDGTPSWQAFQIDETALPIVMISRLVESGHTKYSEFRGTVRKAAQALIHRGPATGQERWEENGGLSNNSFAAVIEGLRAAAWLEKQSGGNADLARTYAQKADEWQSKLKEWLLIPQGYYGKNYFARLEVGGHDGRWAPERHDYIHIGNKAQGMQVQYPEDQILDGGFLQWIFAGLVDPHDADFTNTLKIYDLNVRKQTSAGLGYRRYNHDSFGENHEGGAWPLLSVERALTALERGESAEVLEGRRYIRASSSDAGVICEQDTLSVCPLGWSHAAYLILEKSIAEGRSYYVPRRAR